MNIVYKAWCDAYEKATPFRFTVYMKGGNKIYGAPHRFSETDEYFLVDAIIVNGEIVPTWIKIDHVEAVSMSSLK